MATTATEGHAAITGGRRTRVVVIRVIYTLLSVYALLMAQGIVRLLLGTTTSGAAIPEGWEFTLWTSTIWKLLALGGALVLAWTGGRSTLAAQGLLVGVLCWSAADALAPADPDDPRPWALLTVQNLVIWVGPWLVLSNRRRELLRLPTRPRPLPVAIAGAGAVVSWGYAAVLAAHAAGAGRAFDVVGLYVALGAFAAWGALVLTRSSLPLRVTCAAAALTAAAAALWPGALGSPGPLAALVLLAWTAALLVSARARRTT